MKKYIWVATLCSPVNSLLKNKTLKDSFHWIQDDFCSHNIDKVDIPCLLFFLKKMLEIIVTIIVITVIYLIVDNVFSNKDK